MAKKEKKINIDDIPGDNIRRLDKLKDLLTPYSGDPTENLHPAFKTNDELVVIDDEDDTSITVINNDNKLSKKASDSLREQLYELNLTDKQLAFISVYARLNYHISHTCEQIGVQRQSYYDWLKNPNFKMAIDCLHEAYIDDAVSCMNRAIANDNIDAAKFVLKTLGRRRGFIESMDITSNGETIGVPTINIIMPQKLDE